MGFYKKNYLYYVYIAKKPPKPVCRQNPNFCSITPCKTDVIGFRVEFCAQHNRLEQQHKSWSESGVDFFYAKNRFFRVKPYFLVDDPL